MELKRGYIAEQRRQHAKAAAEALAEVIDRTPAQLELFIDELAAAVACEVLARMGTTDE